MLTFMRNKVVGIERRGADTLWVYGVLDDDIYGVELETALRLPDMVILSIQGKFKRWTTPECPKAIPVLQAAVGLCTLEESFSQRVQKDLGRKGCRHFATLLIECCDAAQKAASLIAGQEPLKRILTTSAQKAPQGRAETEPAAATSESGKKGFEPRGEKKTTIIDMHVHTYPASPCSVMRVDQVIEEARRIGLDGVCLTDHNHVWDRFQVEELRGKNDGFLILRGNEITTDQGDVIVFGLDTPVPGVILLEEGQPHKILRISGHIRYNIPDGRILMVTHMVFEIRIDGFDMPLV